MCWLNCKMKWCVCAFIWVHHANTYNLAIECDWKHQLKHRPIRTDHENTLAAEVDCTMQPMLAAAEMCHRPTDAHTEMVQISVWMVSFARNLDAAIGWPLLRNHWWALLVQVDRFAVCGKMKLVLNMPRDEIYFHSPRRQWYLHLNSQLISIPPMNTDTIPRTCNDQPVERFLCLQILLAKKQINSITKWNVMQSMRR